MFVSKCTKYSFLLVSLVMMLVVLFSPDLSTSLTDLTSVVGASHGLHQRRLLDGKTPVISSHICRKSQSQEVTAKCALMIAGRNTFTPDNSTIYHVYKPVKDPDIKYFHESATDPHRDKRFPRMNRNMKQPDPNANKPRNEILREIFRNWVSFTKERNLVFWIAHGLLLGWYWNNDLMPWDFDLDVQVTAHDLLNQYSKHHNTLYRDRYLFDVNPHKIYRLHQYDNVIDARFIDTYTGYYVDITGLAFNPKKKVLQCKSPHSYDVNAIFPLQSSVFIGQEVWVPNRVEPILAKEYKEQSMTRPSHSVASNGRRHNYRFDEKSMKWVK